MFHLFRRSFVAKQSQHIAAILAERSQLDKHRFAQPSPVELIKIALDPNRVSHNKMVETVDIPHGKSMVICSCEFRIVCDLALSNESTLILLANLSVKTCRCCLKLKIYLLHLYLGFHSYLCMVVATTHAHFQSLFALMLIKFSFD